jgi:hypothetical protein
LENGKGREGEEGGERMGEEEREGEGGRRGEEGRGGERRGGKGLGMENVPFHFLKRGYASDSKYILNT